MIGFIAKYTQLSKWAALTALIAAAYFSANFVLTSAENRGYERRNAEYQAQEKQLVAEIERAIAEGVKDSAAREAKALQQLADIRHNAGVRAQALSNHLKKKEIPDDQAPGHAQFCTASAQEDGGSLPALGDVVLDSTTVRMLNDARANLPFGQDGDAQPDADAEGTPAEPTEAITGADLALSDLEVVQMYHELAARHGGLVDWVRAQCISPAIQFSEKDD